MRCPVNPDRGLVSKVNGCIGLVTEIRFYGGCQMGRNQGYRVIIYGKGNINKVLEPIPMRCSKSHKFYPQFLYAYLTPYLGLRVWQRARPPLPVATLPFGVGGTQGGLPA